MTGHSPVRRAAASRRLLLALAAASLAACGRSGTVQVAGAPRADDSLALRRANLSSLILAERAFAQMGRDSGTHASFLANLADSAILYRPGPVNGPRWLRENPPVNRVAVLVWEPRWADVSTAGDMGFTTGPYEVRLRGVQDTAAGRGHFVSVWRREGSGPWRVMLDAGAAGPQQWTLSREGWGEWESPAEPPVPPSGTAAGSQEDELLAADREIGAGTEPGWRAFVSRLDAGARVYRQLRPVTVGRDDARRALEGTAATYRASPEASLISRSSDLAMTRGSYRLEGPNGAATEQGHYVRLWRRAGDGRWYVVIDLALPIAQRRP